MAKFSRSYAQGGQDVLAASILGEKKNVTYIDVGCLWPAEQSNTFFFYEKGGFGLCIDPNPTLAEEFALHRPRDTFVNSGVGSEDGELMYFMFERPVYNTFSAERAARASKRRDMPILDRRPIPIRRLGDIVRSSPLAGKEVDLLSIDVEGFEDQVLAGIDFAELSPRLIVIEHIAPFDADIFDNRVGALLPNYKIAAFTGHDIFYLRR